MHFHLLLQNRSGCWASAVVFNAVLRRGITAEYTLVVLRVPLLESPLGTPTIKYGSKYCRADSGREKLLKLFQLSKAPRCSGSKRSGYSPASCNLAELMSFRPSSNLFSDSFNRIRCLIMKYYLCASFFLEQLMLFHSLLFVPRERAACYLFSDTFDRNLMVVLEKVFVIH